jgi:hypothetical protein
VAAATGREQRRRLGGRDCQRRRTSLTINRVNRGILGYADAILAGRAGDHHQATELALAADRELRQYPVWADLARLCAAEPALADGWGQPQQWLEKAAGVFARHGIEPLALRCRRLLEHGTAATEPLVQDRHHRPAGRRTPARGRGISNKEIAARLHLSPPYRGETHRKPPPQDRCPVPNPASGNHRPGITHRRAAAARPCVIMAVAENRYLLSPLGFGLATKPDTQKRQICAVTS